MSIFLTKKKKFKKAINKDTIAEIHTSGQHMDQTQG